MDFTTGRFYSFLTIPICHKQVITMFYGSGNDLGCLLGERLFCGVIKINDCMKFNRTGSGKKWM